MGRRETIAMQAAKRIAVSLLFFLTGSLMAQNILYDSKLCVKIAPLAILDVYSGMSPRAGVEFKLKTKHALYTEIGSYLPYVNSMHRNLGALTKLEYKYYLNKNGQTSGNYFSAELLYKHQSYGTSDSILIQPFYSKDYHVDKDVGCFTIKFGEMKVYKRHLVVDSFVGLGIRYTSIRNSLTNEENKYMQRGGGYGFNIFRNGAQNQLIPNVDLGIKIGYRFK